MTAIDHLFVCCAPGAPEADTLVGLGFHEGSGNTHPGQGTANRRFFFRNAYLEPERLGREPTTHPNRVMGITRVEIGLQGSGPLSRAAGFLQERGLVSFQPADSSVMALTFDDASAGGGADLRPDLPLVLRW